MYNLTFSAGGSNNHPCSEIYAGPAAFSEIEIKSMSEYINSISDKFYAYIGLHGYSQLLMFPYGYTTDRVDNYDNMVSDCNYKTNIALRN